MKKLLFLMLFSGALTATACSDVHAPGGNPANNNNNNHNPNNGPGGTVTGTATLGASCKKDSTTATEVCDSSHICVIASSGETQGTCAVKCDSEGENNATCIGKKGSTENTKCAKKVGFGGEIFVCVDGKTGSPGGSGGPGGGTPGGNGPGGNGPGGGGPGGNTPGGNGPGTGGSTQGAGTAGALQPCEPASSEPGKRCKEGYACFAHPGSESGKGTCAFICSDDTSCTKEKAGEHMTKCHADQTIVASTEKKSVCGPVGAGPGAGAPQEGKLGGTCDKAKVCDSGLVCVKPIAGAPKGICSRSCASDTSVCKSAADGGTQCTEIAVDRQFDGTSVVKACGEAGGAPGIPQEGKVGSQCDDAKKCDSDLVCVKPTKDAAKGLCSKTCTGAATECKGIQKDGGTQCGDIPTDRQFGGTSTVKACEIGGGAGMPQSGKVGAQCNATKACDSGLVCVKATDSAPEGRCSKMCTGATTDCQSESADGGTQCGDIPATRQFNGTGTVKACEIAGAGGLSSVNNSCEQGSTDPKKQCAAGYKCYNPSQQSDATAGICLLVCTDNDSCSDKNTAGNGMTVCLADQVIVGDSDKASVCYTDTSSEPGLKIGEECEKPADDHSFPDPDKMCSQEKGLVCVLDAAGGNKGKCKKKCEQDTECTGTATGGTTCSENVPANQVYSLDMGMGGAGGMGGGMGGAGGMGGGADIKVCAN